MGDGGMVNIVQEDRLKQKFVTAVSPYFHVKPEVKGKHLADGYPVRIDFLILPKKELVAVGFDPWWAGVEVKHLGADCGTKKVNQLFAQAITYQQCVYHGDNHDIRPIFTLLHTDNQDDNATFGYLRSLAQYLNVGTFEFTRYGWKIGFGGGSYFRYGRYNGVPNLIKGNVPNLGTKLYIGNATIGRDLTTEKYIPERYHVERSTTIP